MSEFGLLDRKERALRAEADVLDKELAEIRQRREAIEEMLQRIAGARTTLQDLLVDESEAGGRQGEDCAGSVADDDEPDGDEAASATERGATAGDGPNRSTRDPVDMEEARRRAVTLLASSGRKMRARAIAEAIGEDVSTPARVETTRGRLKTLVTEGTLEEEPPGVFYIATSKRSDSGGAEPEGTA
ncbi:hypothetical protein [Streptomyces antimycoticus]|uniref:hypothetical protein n=1 Tax=Streptomyces antimycoticus TaxID=68175 RepID=UPI00386B7A74|nr:hypothetical protein OG751_28750 [Streptomyces antimycoticus]